MTRRMSQRAQAQEIYREMAAANAAANQAIPIPGLTAQNLTEKVHKLYENTAVPVREIALLAGVTERTIYKYARKGGWTPRYAWIDRGGVRGRRRRARTFCAGDFAPVKGAGGRFVARSDKGKSFAAGLKATDPPGAARAAAACRQADELAGAAQAEAEEAQRFEVHLRAMDDVHRALGQLNAHRAGRNSANAARRRADDLIERALCLAADLAIDRWEALLALSHPFVPAKAGTQEGIRRLCNHDPGFSHRRANARRSASYARE